VYKKSVALAVSSLFFSLGAQAQQPEKAEPPSEIAQVYTEAAREVSALDAKEPNINKRIAAYDKFSFSPELKPRLKAVFGTDKPFAPQRLPDSRGRQHYQSVLKAGSHTDEQGHVAWSDIILKGDTSPAGNQVNYTGEMASLNVGVVSRLQLSDLRVAGRQARASDGLWYGDVHMSVARIAVEDGTAGKLLMEDLRFKTDMQRRGKTVDLAYGLSIRSAGAGEHKVERVNVATRVLGMDGQVMADFTRFASSPQLQQLAPAAQTQVMLRKFKELGVALLKGGVSVVIDDISAAWKGQVASIKGRIDFAKATDAELNSLPAIVKKLAVRLEVRVPVVIIEEFSRANAAKAVKSRSPAEQAANPAQMAALEQNMADKVMTDIRQSGFAVVDKDEVRTVIELKNGVLTLNGKGPSMFGLKDGKLSMPSTPTPMPMQAR